MSKKTDPVEANSWTIGLGAVGAVVGGVGMALIGAGIGRLIDEERMTKKRAFISFDFDHDEDLRNMLAGQAKHPDTPFDFFDRSVKEPMTGDWEAKVRGRISNTDVTVILCGEYTHTARGVSVELRISRELDKPYFLLWGRKGKICTKPTAALESDNIYEWTWPNLKALIGGSR